MAVINSKYLNPFVIGIDIPNEYFCDRETETAKLLSRVYNGNNTVLTARRRIGKSSLLMHLLHQDEVKKGFNTLFVDIYQTKNMEDFVKQLCKSIQDPSYNMGQAVFKKLSDTIPEVKLYAKLKTGVFNAGVDVPIKTQQEKTLDSIFAFLEKTTKPNIVVFDEFQTIEEYPEKMSAMLRTLIQKMKNTHFIFSGSSKHMLQSMFKEENKPFYKSALSMELDIIPEPQYTEFCQRLFKARGKAIDQEAVHFAYNLFGANTLELQQIMNGVFAYTPNGKTANVDYVRYAIEDYLQDNDSYFRELFGNERSIKERNLIQCIAIEGIATGLTSQEKIQNYYLAGASSVSATLNKLTNAKKPLLVRIGDNGYRLLDKFFELWISNEMGILEQKYQTAEKMFKKERQMVLQTPKTDKPKKMPNIKI